MSAENVIFIDFFDVKVDGSYVIAGICKEIFVYTRKNAQYGYGLLTGLNNVELPSTNKVELARMNKVELASTNKVELASMNKVEQAGMNKVANNVVQQ